MQMKRISQSYLGKHDKGQEAIVGTAFKQVLSLQHSGGKRDRSRIAPLCPPCAGILTVGYPIDARNQLNDVHLRRWKCAPLAVPVAEECESQASIEKPVGGRFECMGLAPEGAKRSQSELDGFKSLLGPAKSPGSAGIFAH